MKEGRCYAIVVRQKDVIQPRLYTLIYFTHPSPEDLVRFGADINFSRGDTVSSEEISPALHGALVHAKRLDSANQYINRMVTNGKTTT